MRSVSTSFTWLTLALGYFTSTVFVDIINSVTKRITPSKQGWLHGNDLNSNNLNLFYWFLAILNVINFVFYLFSASWYKYKSDDRESETIAKAEKGPNGEITLVK
jgi:peptide/histidine transporter 3/4